MVWKQTSENGDDVERMFFNINYGKLWKWPLLVKLQRNGYNIEPKFKKCKSLVITDMCGKCLLSLLKASLVLNKIHDLTVGVGSTCNLKQKNTMHFAKVT